MKNAFQVISILSILLSFSTCSSDNNKEIVIGNELGDVERDGDLYYFEKYNLWGIEDSDVSMDSKEFYLILNPDDFVKTDQDKNKQRKVAVTGTLFQSEIKEKDFENYFFIKIKTLNYK